MWKNLTFISRGYSVFMHIPMKLQGWSASEFIKNSGTLSSK